MMGNAAYLPESRKMETTEHIKISEAFVNGFKKAVTELEEFRVQAALGKTEARDAFKGAKKKFDVYAREAKQKLNAATGNAFKNSVRIIATLETLQVQLALGKAVTKEKYEEQRRKIVKALNELERMITKNKIADEYYTRLLMEAGKFRIKLDILKLRYELNKLEARMEFEAGKKEFSKTLVKVKDRLIKKGKENEAVWKHVTNELNEAYSHLRKAFLT